MNGGVEGKEKRGGGTPKIRLPGGCQRVRPGPTLAALTPRMSSQPLVIGKFSLGMGDRFAHEAEAQLAACLAAVADTTEVHRKLGEIDDPQLPADSFDRIFMVHMYHEVTEPYAFLWNMWPALNAGGQIVVVESDSPVGRHGIPHTLLFCEFEALCIKFKPKKKREYMCLLIRK